uniref:Integrase catalytic domain-containing protein n=1 Tax=Nicotiana tabacum TaxID=4097 RepID=A0A1S4A0I3_TOBAC|nr:PREDICTED: uncharacterized protein LOC107792413 [Nicotiana tabacum]
MQTQQGQSSQMQAQPQLMMHTTGLHNSGQGKQTSQTPAYSFTKEQYDQIVQMLNKVTGTIPSANMAPISSACLVDNKAHGWIIDTGATNHMVSDPNLLSKAEEIKPSNSKQVHLPNGEDLYSGIVIAIGIETGSLYILAPHVAKIQGARSMVVKEAEAKNLQSVAQKEEVDVELWHKRLGTQFDKVVKIIRTDNGTEFVNSTCTELFQALGVMHQRTCAYTPQYNGVAESKYRHILEVARAMRMPSTVMNGASPFEKMYNRKPLLDHLRVMGCLCYAKDVQVHDKFMPRAIPAVLMGYSSVQKGYVLLNLTNNCFFVNKDAAFKENVFPFRNQHTLHSLIFLPPDISTYDPSPGTNSGYNTVVNHEELEPFIDHGV